MLCYRQSLSEKVYGREENNPDQTLRSQNCNLGIKIWKRTDKLE